MSLSLRRRLTYRQKHGDQLQLHYSGLNDTLVDIAGIAIEYLPAYNGERMHIAIHELRRSHSYQNRISKETGKLGFYLDPYTGQNFEHRCQWVLDRLRELVDIFVIDVCAYTILSHHCHVVLHVDADRAKEWTDHQVIEQWNRLYEGHMLTDRYLAGEIKNYHAG
ncbi:MAG: hypothetical protein ABW155_08295 [Candidatus Thiodiazotropha sp.]